MNVAEKAMEHVVPEDILDILDEVGDNVNAATITNIQFAGVDQDISERQGIEEDCFDTLHSKKIPKKPILKETRHIISVAKGSKKKLTTSLTLELSLSTSGNFYKKADLGFKASAKKTVEKGEEFSGPPESSKDNCREYYERSYDEEGQWKQWYTDSSGYTTKSTSGTYQEPLKFNEFNLDVTEY